MARRMARREAWIDVDAVDLEGVGRGDGPGHGALANPRGQYLAAFGIELLAIAQAADGAIGRENDGGGEDRAEQRAAAHLIDAGDALRNPAARASRSYFPWHLINVLPTRNCGTRARDRGRAGLVAFAETRCFALQIAQIVKLGAAHAAGAHHVDVVDHRGVKRENALHALAKADLAHRDGFAEPRVLAGDHGAFESLQSLFVAFFDLDVDADGVAGAEFRHLAACVLADELWSVGGSACDKSLNSLL